MYGFPYELVYPHKRHGHGTLKTQRTFLWRFSGVCLTE